MRSRSNWNLEVLVFFKERESTGVPEEKPFEGIKGENQQQTQPRYGMYGTAGFEPGHIGGKRVLSPPVTLVCSP